MKCKNCGKDLIVEDGKWFHKEEGYNIGPSRCDGFWFVDLDDTQREGNNFVNHAEPIDRAYILKAIKKYNEM